VADQPDLPGARALGLRCRGLAEGPVEDLGKAIEMHLAIGNAYEAARTQLCLGEMLRRRGKRMEIRGTLSAALETFEATGAPAWAERARSELELSGVSTRRRVPSSRLELTPQERNVARLVATGLTNREIADRLFVTLNTVETHLRHIFQKLDVTSRTQLVIAVGDRLD
jgi:DNA-binding NarL/FixJ family response regulator